MTNTIKIKHNITNSDAPTTSNFSRGEIAFTENTQTAIINGLLVLTIDAGTFS